MCNRFTYSEINIDKSIDFPAETDNIYYKIEIIVDIYLKNHSDVASEYLEIAFVAQELSEVSDIIKVYETPIIDNYPYTVIIIKCINLNETRMKLEWFKTYFSGEFDTDEDEINAIEDFFTFNEAICEFNIVPVLPDYCDKYFANYIVSNYDWFPEDIQKSLSIHPEWAFYTWKSAWSKKLGFDFYVSGEFWLLDINADLSSAIKYASDYQPPIQEDKFLKPISIITDMNNIYLFTREDIVCIKLNLHFSIARCAEILFPFDEDKFVNTNFNWGISNDFYITNDLSLIVFKGGSFQYVLFYESIIVLNKRETDAFSSVIQKLSANLLERSSDSIKIRCNWTLINDEIFEEICYDLILRDGRFVAKETRKMGLSKSRDGGRDIITMIASHSGQNKKNRLWIIQCKYSKKRKSLGRNDVRLSDLIDEYSPAGIIIATNMVIDAGTYDKNEKIKKNRCVDIEYWDLFWIERLLNKNPDLFRVYNLTAQS